MLLQMRNRLVNTEFDKYRFQSDPATFSVVQYMRPNDGEDNDDNDDDNDNSDGNTPHGLVIGGTMALIIVILCLAVITVGSLQFICYGASQQLLFSNFFVLPVLPN